MNKQQAIKHKAETLDRLKESTIVDPKSSFDVVDEGLGHILENFHPGNEPQFKRDYVFIMGKAYLGSAIKSPCEDVYPNIIYCDGNLHEFSHDLAALMKLDPRISESIFHAVHIFGQLK